MSNERPGEERPEWLPRVDLCAVTRDSHLVKTIISVKLNNVYHRWIEFGSWTDSGNRRDTVGARYERVTDPEHSSAYAFAFDVTDIQFEYNAHGVLTFRAWIAGAADKVDSLRVPSKSITKLTEVGAKRCRDRDCKAPSEQHHVVERFVPEPDVALWKKIRGCEIRIEVLPKISKDDE